MKAQQVIFHGEVQGEGFRYAIAHEAMSYDIKGEVHNMPDGTIKAQIVGSDEEIESFLQDLRDGRFGEDITEITMEEVELEPLQRMSGFQFHWAIAERHPLKRDHPFLGRGRPKNGIFLQHPTWKFVSLT